jgi:ribosomal protein L20A (L18A)
MSRKFTIIGVSTVRGVEKGPENVGGVFHSNSPVGAAKKALSKVCARSKVHGRCTLVVTIQEITKGSAGKIYRYKIQRIVNKTTVIKDGVPITFRYTTRAVSLL